MNYRESAIAWLIGESIELREQHRIYWLLLQHAHLTDYAQAGRKVLLEELRRGPQLMRRIPFFGMTTVQEQAYCEWYCAHLFTGAGDIIELGTFLGSLTKSMVNGLRANPLPAVQQRKVRVFDLFYWDFVMAACVANTAYADCCKEGDWFIEFYRQSLRAWIDRTEIKQADLTCYQYNGQPIEFLMVDVMKYESLCQQVTHEFFPHLIPGKGILFHQDYLHFYESWVHVIQFLLRDYFRPLTPIDGSGAFVFQCIAAVPAERCQLSGALKETWRNELIEASFDWSEAIVGEQARHTVSAARVMMYAHLGRWDQAHRAWQIHAPKYPGSHAFGDLRKYLATNKNLELPAV